jgi:HK97 gp10 family phage protein
MTKITKYGDPLKGSGNGTIKSLIEIAAKMASQAKELAPVDKGVLRNSIGYKIEDLNTAEPQLETSVKEKTGIVGTGVEYASYQEFGTKKMKAQPFLRPAVDVIRGNNGLKVIKKYSLKEMEKALKKGVKVKKL